MFKMVFGFVWTAFTTPIFIFCITVPAEQRNGAEMSPFLFAILSMFELIGLYLIFSGLRQVIRDKKTEKYGMQCYGIVRNIVPTGASVNNRPEYKAVLDIINPETQQVETIEEIIGFDYDKYPINTYCLCKYYRGDINIEEQIPDNTVSENTKQYLPQKQLDANSQNIDYSVDPDLRMLMEADENRGQQPN